MKDHDKSMVEVVKSQRLWILKLVLLVQLMLLSYLLYTAIGDGRYFVAHEDEVINFCSAKVFSETGSVQAEGCIAEDVSRIWKMNWYGPGYHLFYGTFKKILGDSPVLFIQLHFVFALITVALVFLLPQSTEIKLLIANALVFTQQFTAYIFTYFPEALHLLFAILLILLLTSVYHAKTTPERNRRIALFIAIVMIISIARVTTVFWLAALIGLSESRKMALKMTVVFAICLSIVLVYMKWFTAPPYAGEMQKIDQLYQFDLFGFVWKTVQAMARNTYLLIISGSLSVYFLLMLLVVAMVRWWKTRERFLRGALLVSLALMAALMAFYSSYPWYFLKQSAVLVPLLLVGLMISSSATGIKYFIVAISLVTYFFTFLEVRNIIRERRDAFVRVENGQPFSEALQQLPQFIAEPGSVVILWCYNEYDFGGATEALLPFATKDHRPILYTSNIILKDEKPEVRFKLHHKLKVDYMLSRYPVDWPLLQEVYSTAYFHFYKVKQPGD